MDMDIGHIIDNKTMRQDIFIDKDILYRYDI